MKTLFFITSIALFYSKNCFCYVGNVAVSNRLRPGESELEGHLDDASCEDNSSPRSFPNNYTLHSDIITYFQNLYEFAAVNFGGSCGYVSLIQCLTYYDTFKNDLIIPDNYDKHDETANNELSAISNSPGVLKSEGWYNDYTSLYSFVDNNYLVDYEAYLLKVENEIEGCYNSSDFSGSISMAEYEALFDAVFGQDAIDFDICTSAIFPDIASSSCQQYMETYVKNKLDLEQPVVLHIKDTQNTNYYHSVVAYYYDDYGIHCHFGHGPNSTDWVLSSTQIIERAGVILFNSPYYSSTQHSNNYYYSLNYYCGCGRHKHEYGSVYFQYDSMNHKQLCVCGDIKLTGHIYGGGYYGCALCGYLP